MYLKKNCSKAEHFFQKHHIFNRGTKYSVFSIHYRRTKRQVSWFIFQPFCAYTVFLLTLLNLGWYNTSNPSMPKHFDFDMFWSIFSINLYEFFIYFDFKLFRVWFFYFDFLDLNLFGLRSIWILIYLDLDFFISVFYVGGIIHQIAWVKFSIYFDLFLFWSNLILI
jgi:hypothetical protein